MHWLNTILELKRHHIFGKKIVSKLVINPATSLASSTHINVDNISKQSDPQLRYALRLQSAAESAGAHNHGSSRHAVAVDATNEGMKSQFTGATYTGIIKDGRDTFLENLRRFAPDYDGNYGQE